MEQIIRKKNSIALRQTYFHFKVNRTKPDTLSLAVLCPEICSGMCTLYKVDVIMK